MNEKEQGYYIAELLLGYLSLIQDQWQADDLTANNMAREVGSQIDLLLAAGIEHEQLDEFARYITGVK